MITYEQAVKLVYLGFRLMIIYKLITVVLYMPTTIPSIIREVRKSKEFKAKMKRDEEAVIMIKDGSERIRSNYKSTTIGFVTTEPMIDEKESS